MNAKELFETTTRKAIRVTISWGEGGAETRIYVAMAPDKDHTIALSYESENRIPTNDTGDVLLTIANTLLHPDTFKVMS